MLHNLMVFTFTSGLLLAALSGCKQNNSNSSSAQRKGSQSADACSDGSKPLALTLNAIKIPKTKIDETKLTSLRVFRNEKGFGGERIEFQATGEHFSYLSCTSKGIQTRIPPPSGLFCPAYKAFNQGLQGVVEFTCTPCTEHSTTIACNDSEKKQIPVNLTALNKNKSAYNLNVEECLDLEASYALAEQLILVGETYIKSSQKLSLTENKSSLETSERNLATQMQTISNMGVSIIAGAGRSQRHIENQIIAANQISENEPNLKLTQNTDCLPSDYIVPKAYTPKAASVPKIDPSILPDMDNDVEFTSDKAQSVSNFNENLTDQGSPETGEPEGIVLKGDERNDYFKKALVLGFGIPALVIGVAWFTYNNIYDGDVKTLGTANKASISAKLNPRGGPFNVFSKMTMMHNNKSMRQNLDVVDKLSTQLDSLKASKASEADIKSLTKDISDTMDKIQNIAERVRSQYSPGGGRINRASLDEVYRAYNLPEDFTQESIDNIRKQISKANFSAADLDDLAINLKKTKAINPSSVSFEPKLSPITSAKKLRTLQQVGPLAMIGIGITILVAGAAGGVYLAGTKSSPLERLKQQMNSTADGFETLAEKAVLRDLQRLRASDQ